MLEGLDSVNWKAIKHWWGPASDIPVLIRDLTSSNSDTRVRAYEQLGHRIAHQQELCEATAYVVPFLFELLGEDSVDNKRLILELLIDCAGGGFYNTESRQWSERSYKAVAEGQPIIEEYLDHRDAAVRRVAGELLLTLVRTHRAHDAASRRDSLT